MCELNKYLNGISERKSTSVHNSSRRQILSSWQWEVVSCNPFQSSLAFLLPLLSQPLSPSHTPQKVEGCPLSLRKGEGHSVYSKKSRITWGNISIIYFEVISSQMKFLLPNKILMPWQWHYHLITVLGFDLYFSIGKSNHYDLIKSWIISVIHDSLHSFFLKIEV